MKHAAAAGVALRQRGALPFAVVLALHIGSASASRQRLRNSSGAVDPEGAELSHPQEKAFPAMHGDAWPDTAGPAVAALLHFLEDRRGLPPYSEFHPRCVAHVRGVVQSVDRDYSDLQLETVLENECALDEEFVSVESGFDGPQACRKFAKRLAEARMEELETGSGKGYERFCDKYYVHKGGTIPKEKPKQPEPKKAVTTSRPEPAKVADKGNATGTATGNASSNATSSVKEAAKQQDSKEKAPAEDKPEEEEGKVDPLAGLKKTNKVGQFPILAISAWFVGVVAFIAGGFVVRSMKPKI